MDVPPIQPPAGVPGVAPRDAAAGTDLPFTVGQRLFAQVVQVVGDRAAILELAGQRLSAATPMPVTPGQVLAVTVRGTGAVIDLELAEPPVAFSDAAYALASVLQARRAAGAGAPVTPVEVQSLLQAFARAWAPRGQEAQHAGQAARVSDALTPLPIDQEGPRLADTLRRAISQSGVFLESKLAAAMRGGAFADLASLGADARAVLGELAVVTKDSPALEEIRSRLAADVLARQIEVVYHKIKEDELRLVLPVTIDQTPSELQMAVRDAPEDDQRESAGGRQIDLALELPDFGRVRASISWTPGHLATRFTVRDREHAERLDAVLDGLSMRLRAVGFRQVVVGVDVDPARLDRPFAPDGDPPDPELPGGSILRARA